MVSKPILPSYRVVRGLNGSRSETHNASTGLTLWRGLDGSRSETYNASTGLNHFFNHRTLDMAYVNWILIEFHWIC